MPWRHMGTECIVQCLWSLVPLGRRMYSVWGTWPLLTAKCTMFWPLLDANCNLLCYRRPLNLLHSFIYDSTSRHYNLSFTMSSDPLLSCLGAALGSLLSSISVCPECWQLTGWLLLTESESYVTTDSQSASLSWYKHPSGLTTRFLFPYGIRNMSDSCGFVDMGRSLWREDGSVVCNCFWS
jgi:hypothetical protein